MIYWNGEIFIVLILMMERQYIILIVEDEVALSSALRLKLEAEGYIVLVAVDGEEGLAMAIERKPDLILLDIIMPKMDGMTMLGKLREDSRGRDFRVIILTNLSDEDKIEEAKRHGSYDYLIKADWKIEDILDKVREHLR